MGEMAKPDINYEVIDYSIRSFFTYLNTNKYLRVDRETKFLRMFEKEIIGRWQKIEIEITEKIAEKLREIVESNDTFKDTEEYINYILEQVVERLKSEAEEEPVYSKKDEEKIRGKLRDLGYLD